MRRCPGKAKMCDIISRYIESLWEGKTERLTHFDKDGTTSWSEAPAEGIFSILEIICDKKPGRKLSNLTKFFRIIKEGPQPGSILAKSLIESSIEKWPRSYGPRFVTSNYMLKTTSKVVAKILKN